MEDKQENVWVLPSSCVNRLLRYVNGSSNTHLSLALVTAHYRSQRFAIICVKITCSSLSTAVSWHWRWLKQTTSRRWGALPHSYTRRCTLKWRCTGILLRNLVLV